MSRRGRRLSRLIAKLKVRERKDERLERLHRRSSRSAFRRIRLPAFFFVGGVESDSRDSRCFLEQIAGGASFVSGHHRTCG